MLGPKKNLSLKKYAGGIFRYLLTSQLAHPTFEHYIRLQKLRLQIQTKKQKQIHYLYFWLWTKKMPYLQKFYPSWKNTSSHRFLKTKPKKYALKLNVSSKNKFPLLSQMIREMVPRQPTSEKRVWNFHYQHVTVRILSLPLIKQTSLLQMKNTYFPNIPLQIQFSFSKATAFEKIFFLRAFKFLSSSSKNPGLDDFSDPYFE